MSEFRDPLRDFENREAAQLNRLDRIESEDRFRPPSDEVVRQVMEQRNAEPLSSLVSKDLGFIEGVLGALSLVTEEGPGRNAIAMSLDRLDMVRATIRQHETTSRPAGVDTGEHL